MMRILLARRSRSKPTAISKRRHQKQAVGFTLVEVMVAIMVSSIFVAITMQSIVTAAFFRARAEQFDEAVNWIQEDLESVIKRAGRYETDTFPRPFSSRCDAVNVADALPAGFISDAAGLGGAVVTVGTKSFGGKSFELKRTADYATSSDPRVLLKVLYEVVPVGGGVAIATTTTEVLPYAVLRCR
jgi:prepilin-type N-terminal cleavage/methylation domain-containing protein